MTGREPGLVPASIVPPWPAEGMVHSAAISLGTAPAAWLCPKGSGVHGDLEKRVRVTKHVSAFLRSQPLARGDPLTFPERAETGPNRVWLQGPHLGRKKVDPTQSLIHEHVSDPAAYQDTFLEAGLTNTHHLPHLLQSSRDGNLDSLSKHCHVALGTSLNLGRGACSCLFFCF